MNILVIPFFDVKLSLKYGFRTRDAHIYEHLLKNKSDRILIVNRPTSLIEIFLRRKKLRTDGKKIYQKNRMYISQLDDNIYVLDIFAFDFFNVAIRRRGWIPYIYQHSILEKKIKKALEIIGFNDYAVYTSTPFAIPLILKLNCRRRILDADDNFTQHSEYAFYRDKIADFYVLSKKYFDVIVCTNHDTIRYFQEGCKAKLILIPNGVDIERFRKEYQVPHDLSVLKRPIVGYAGNMQRMLDVDLMYDLAESFPNVNFVFIGNILDAKLITPMFEKRNIIYLGDKTYDDYPAYVKNFDICSIPYVVENQHGGDPMKFYEYMAAERKIVSTNIGEIAKYNDDNFIIITTRAEYKKRLQYLLGKTIKSDYPQLPYSATWKYKADMFRDELQYE